jgi:DNA-binding transcriptional regulator YdaS (Cro superfamily)
MDKLHAYLKTLSPDEQKAFAILCETSIGYLRKALSAKQVLGAELCVLIEQNSDSKVTRQDLRPNDWMKIWPELQVAA